MNHVNAYALTEEARHLIDSAERQGRDLADFEAGRVDALLDIAERLTEVDRDDIRRGRA